ncbi:hypothetical protein PMZ80_009362 [Knufia obscura]|uniref:Enoyl reductase (ER) domain-containing protein n=2 Tax=Knufia TaxID=430999 RepID=A0AAN8I9N6_9EURO|nr:hypothetical protein PMZ80_009362 [Knufia obscura]KAK5955821.1 hypothetical protein OHC33_003462 [Knufia fluminis]
MKAIIASGDKKVDFTTERPKPTLKHGEVLVKIAATPVLPSDLLNISGGFPRTTFPIIPGRDYAGVVIEPESSPWHGKSVYGTSGPDLSITRDGTHAEFVAVPEDALAGVPRGMSLEAASMVGTTWTTAWMVLSRARAEKGEVVLVLGAGGGVGGAVVQLGRSRLWGCSVLTAGRGGKYDVDVAADPELLGAREKMDGRGVDVVVDTTGNLGLASAGLGVLGKGGRLCVITTGASRGSMDVSVSVDFKELYRLEKSIVGCNSFEHSMREMAGWLAELAEGFESGELRAPDVDGPKVRKIGLAGVKDVYAEMGSGSRQTFLIVVD